MNRFEDIRQWAEARNLLNKAEGANPQAQMLKGVEEMGEIAAGVARGNVEAVKDSIGDVAVVLTILAGLYDLTIEECIEHAWNEIKDRKGKLVGGIFIKEADL